MPIRFSPGQCGCCEETIDCDDRTLVNVGGFTKRSGERGFGLTRASHLYPNGYFITNYGLHLTDYDSPKAKWTKGQNDSLFQGNQISILGWVRPHEYLIGSAGASLSLSYPRAVTSPVLRLFNVDQDQYQTLQQMPESFFGYFILGSPNHLWQVRTEWSTFSFSGMPRIIQREELTELDILTGQSGVVLIPMPDNPDEQQIITGMMAFATELPDDLYAIPVRLGIGFYRGERIDNTQNFNNTSYIYALDTGELFSYPYSAQPIVPEIWLQYGIYLGVSIPHVDTELATYTRVGPSSLNMTNRIQITDQGYRQSLIDVFYDISRNNPNAYSRCPGAFIDIDLCRQREQVLNEPPTSYRCSVGDLCRPHSYGKVPGEKGIIFYQSPLVNCKDSVHYVILPENYNDDAWRVGENMAWTAKTLYENAPCIPGERLFRLAPNFYVGGLRKNENNPNGRLIEIFAIDLITGHWHTLVSSVPGRRYRPVCVINESLYYAVSETNDLDNEALYRVDINGESELIYDKLYPNNRPDLPDCYRSLDATYQRFARLCTTTTIAYHPVPGVYTAIPVPFATGYMGWVPYESCYIRSSDNIPLILVETNVGNPTYVTNAVGTPMSFSRDYTTFAIDPTGKVVVPSYGYPLHTPDYGQNRRFFSFYDYRLDPGGGNKLSGSNYVIDTTPLRSDIPGDYWNGTAPVMDRHRDSPVCRWTWTSYYDNDTTIYGITRRKSRDFILDPGTLTYEIHDQEYEVMSSISTREPHFGFGTYRTDGVPILPASDGDEAELALYERSFHVGRHWYPDIFPGGYGPVRLGSPPSTTSPLTAEWWYVRALAMDANSTVECIEDLPDYCGELKQGYDEVNVGSLIPIWRWVNDCWYSESARIFYPTQGHTASSVTLVDDKYLFQETTDCHQTVEQYESPSAEWLWIYGFEPLPGDIPPTSEDDDPAFTDDEEEFITEGL